LLTAAAIATVVVLAACAPKTQLVQSWTGPNPDKASVKKVLVLGIAADLTLRRIYEDAFVETLKGLGYPGVSGFAWIPDAKNIDKDAVLARVKAEGVTHILVTRLVGRKQVETYHPPTTTVAVGYAGYPGFAGPGYYGGWSTYYSTGYTQVSQPGYITSNDIASLETNFYDASKEQDALVWTGIVDTYLEGSPAANIEPVIKKVVYEMRAKRVL